jgi:hypothetical protein
MATLLDRCCLLDFGSLQLLWDRITGEYVKVFGRGACLEGGPWELVQEDDKSELISVEAADGGMCRVATEGLLKVRLSKVEGKEDMVKVSEDGREEAEHLFSGWCAERRLRSLQCRVLSIDVPGQDVFMSEYYCSDMPRLCGDKPVMLWMNLKCLVEAARGKEWVSRLTRLGEDLSRLLKKQGLHHSHVIPPAKSQFCLTQTGALKEQCQPLEPAVDEWRVSILCAILYLESLAFNQKFRESESGNGSSRDRAKALLLAMVQKPIAMHGEEIVALALPKAECHVLMRDGVVDWESLKESEEELCKDKCFRTSREPWHIA